MILLNEQEIKSFYTIEDAISDVRETLIAKGQNKVQSPHRTILEFPERNASSLYMPSADLENKVAAVKVVTIFPNNYEKGLPTTQGVIVLTSTETGEHLSFLNASYLTRLRTGAMTALATDYLAKESSEVLTVIGTGGMAFEQVLGVLAVRNIREILLVNRTKERALVFLQKLKDFGISAIITVEEEVNVAVSKADIICCATKSTTPVFNGDYLKPGTHVNGVGSYLPHMHEIDETTIESASKIVVDDVHGAKDEAGELINANHKGVWSFEQLYGELESLVSGHLIGRENEKEITFFKSVGAAYYDLAVAKGVYYKALEDKRGITIEV
ncbi:ornithine cyclodeaminase family protein [Lysinibacillus halotolerans]|uniref:Ornithine cyclodeaminase family protein n=1 Tax=Lysinibacillus halotolerans TaxID=1368476 RepID=A0A3M8HFX9_9BACI|nr:ornithine cyclodeaminase family protein [Lysinibacillus halotolerans]RND00971.1 ornithine cyclodeaminase family protein [Lysinibacillus halotolerans]